MFNVVGQVTSLDTPQGDFDYTYNMWGQPETMTDSSGEWETTYDEDHRATGMTNPWSETTSVTFDTAGRVNRKNLPNGMYETYHFDSRSRVDEIKTYNSSGVWQDTKAYVWDAASRITTATEGGVATTYGYDDIDQLLSESRSGYSASYTYDANGNRLTRTVGGTTETYHYDDADKLTYISVGETTTKSYSYDDAGRTTSMTTSAGTTSFTYDYDGKVTGISYPAQTSDSFGYNGLGARVSTSGTNGSRNFRRAGIGVTSSVLDDGTKKYTPGVSSRQGSTSTFQHSGLKNATEQSNSSQSVTATKKYDAFGNTVSSSGTWQGPFGYAGSFGYQEDPNGLKLLGHRYYDSGTGRFISSDPIGAGSNWYAYAGNDPVSGADPAGLLRIGPNPGWQGRDGVNPTDWEQFALNVGGGLGDGVTAGSPLFMILTGKTSWTQLGREYFGAGAEVDMDSGAYFVGGLLSMLVPMGGAAGAASKAARAAGRACFTEGTDVVMADGSTKDIEDVKAGDEVATFDAAAGKKTTGRVSQTFVSESSGVYTVRFSDGDVVEATAEHPFFVPGRGWIYAAGLKKGDRVKSTVSSAAVASVTFHSGTVRVFNFEVEGTHTYYVGTGKLVHNRCAVDGHHWIPREISLKYFFRRGKWDDSFNDIVVMDTNLHRYLHSGKGYGVVAITTSGGATRSKERVA